MERLVEVRPLPDFKLFLRYDDGAAGEVALAPRRRTSIDKNSRKDSDHPPNLPGH